MLKIITINKNTQLVKNNMMRQKKELQECTYRPDIAKSQGSKSLKRSINDLYQWKDKRDRARERRAAEINHKKWQEYYDMSHSKNLVSPLSRTMASRSRGKGERIEDRLLREGKATEKRRNKRLEQETLKFKKCKNKHASKLKNSMKKKNKNFTLDNIQRPVTNYSQISSELRSSNCMTIQDICTPNNAIHNKSLKNPKIIHYQSNNAELEMSNQQLYENSPGYNLTTRNVYGSLMKSPPNSTPKKNVCKPVKYESLMDKLCRMNKMKQSPSEEPEIERIYEPLPQRVGYEKPFVRSLEDEYFSISKPCVFPEEQESQSNRNRTDDDEYKQKLEQSVIEKILDSEASYKSRREIGSPYDRRVIKPDERFTFQDNINLMKNLLDHENKEVASLKPNEDDKIQSILSDKFTSIIDTFPISSEVSKNQKQDDKIKYIIELEHRDPQDNQKDPQNLPPTPLNHLATLFPHKIPSSTEFFHKDASLSEDFDFKSH
ncbi:unnamed protein product [Moneuplotes crassus]|uniref:Uncharacterized protein n=1 Tax=Euplotes crassus TaxID=5936 RepID=A0AAD2DBH0_EUPCR|nr:unnamed protein product [Moneuplotes crassus]